MHLLIRVCLILSTFITAQSFAQISIPNDEFKENYTEVVDVSGNIYTGIMLTDATLDYEKLVLNAPSIAIDSGWLCIDIQSIDGKYNASIQHELVQPLHGKTNVEFDTNYLNYIQSSKDPQIGVLAKVAKDCSETGIYLPTSWHNSDDHNLVVLLNSSARNNRLMTRLKSGGTKIFRCELIDFQNPVAFNVKCPINELSTVDLSTVRILRSTGGSQQIPIDITISQ